MKILQICAAYKPAFIYGGPTMSVSMLAEQLQQKNIEIEVYATTANGKTELPVKPNEPVTVEGVCVTYFKRITKDHSHFSPALFRKLWKNARNFDVIHIHAWWNLVSLFSCAIALMCGIPVVVSPRGTLSAYSFTNKNISVKRIIHQLFGKRLLNRCFIHVTSDDEEKHISAILTPKGIFKIANFVKLSGCDPDSLTNREVFRLIFLSRIEEKKGLDLLLNALPLLSFPYQLTIAGDGEANYVEQLKDLARSKNIEHNIDWAGFQGDDKFRLLGQHNLLVLPSFDENFGNVIIESLSVGTAVLISPFVGLADYVEENKFGWISDIDADSFSTAIGQIRNNPTELDRIKASAPAKIREDFEANNLCERYIKMYDTILNG